MLVVTTASNAGLEAYGHRWLESRKFWPKGTEFRWYTEGYTVDCPGKDFADMPEFAAWKEAHQFYKPPNWRYNVVAYSHKVFAAIDALYDYDGVGVWCDSDCVTYKPIPDGLIEQTVENDYLGLYQRPGLYTETGFWVMSCAHPEHRAFLDTWKEWYLTDAFKRLSEWHDCMTLDATVRHFRERITVNNLSGEHSKDMHPMAKTEIGKYIDHCKGMRKHKGYSPENKTRAKMLKKVSA